METLRIGIVGYGGSGRGIHSRLLKAAGQRVTDVVTRSRGDQVAADWPGARVHPTIDGLLARASELDLVIIASPTGDHGAHTIAALATGVHVMVDKPLAPTAMEVERVLQASQRAGGRLTVFHNRRWDTEQLTLASVLASGRLGAVHRFERRWERWRPTPQERWKEKDPVAGGLLLDLGAHLVDSATQLFGPVTSVRAELRSLSTAAVDDMFVALTHAAPAGGGPQVISHLQAGSLVGAPGPRTRVLGDKAAFLVTSYEQEASPFSALDTTDHNHGGWLVHGTTRVPVAAAPGNHLDLMTAVIRWVTDGGPPPVVPGDALVTARILDAARTSGASGQTVTL